MRPATVGDTDVQRLARCAVATFRYLLLCAALALTTGLVAACIPIGGRWSNL